MDYSRDNSSKAVVGIAFAVAIVVYLLGGMGALYALLGVILLVGAAVLGFALWCVSRDETNSNNTPTTKLIVGIIIAVYVIVAIVCFSIA